MDKAKKIPREYIPVPSAMGIILDREDSLIQVPTNRHRYLLQIRAKQKQILTSKGKVHRNSIEDRKPNRNSWTVCGKNPKLDF